MYGPVYSVTGQAPPPKISSVPVPWIGRRPDFTIDENHIVAFTPPFALEIYNGQEITDELAVAFYVEDCVVVLAGQIHRLVPVVDIVFDGLRWIFAMPEGVEAADIGGQRHGFIVKFVFDVEPDFGVFSALVFEFDACAIGEGHRQVAVEAPGQLRFLIQAGVGDKGERTDGSDLAVGDTEEITEGDFDARFVGAIPEHFQDDAAEEIYAVRFFFFDVCPVEVFDAAGALFGEQVRGFSGCDGEPVGVLAGAVPA